MTNFMLVHRVWKACETKDLSNELAGNILAASTMCLRRCSTHNPLKSRFDPSAGVYIKQRFRLICAGSTIDLRRYLSSPSLLFLWPVRPHRQHQWQVFGTRADKFQLHAFTATGIQMWLDYMHIYIFLCVCLSVGCPCPKLLSVLASARLMPSVYLPQPSSLGVVSFVTFTFVRALSETLSKTVTINSCVKLNIRLFNCLALAVKRSRLIFPCL